MGERIVRNDEVVGSIPTSSTNLSILYYNNLQTALLLLCKVCVKLRVRSYLTEVDVQGKSEGLYSYTFVIPAIANITHRSRIGTNPTAAIA